MVLPIYAFGHPILKKVGEDINTDYEGLSDLLDNMWETMYHADGVGLAAPQIGRAIRIFLVDTVQTMKEGEEDKGIKIAFINAHILMKQVMILLILKDVLVFLIFQKT